MSRDIVEEWIDSFADHMKTEYYRNRKEKGDSWKNMTVESLRLGLLNEIAESNRNPLSVKEYLDIANFCMFMYFRLKGD